MDAERKMVRIVARGVAIVTLVVVLLFADNPAMLEQASRYLSERNNPLWK